MTQGIWGKIPSIVIGVPSRGNLSIDFIRGLINLQKPPRTQIRFSDTLGIQKARRELVEFALKWRADYLFFLDDDVIPPKDSLIKLLKHNEDIVAGWYPGKRFPIEPAVWVDSLLEEERAPSIPLVFDMLVPVEIMGLGSCLINVDVFREIEPPYFYYSMNKDELCPLYDELSEEQREEAHMDDRGTSEDFWWCRKVRDNGYEVLVDPNIGCIHEGDTKFNPKQYQRGGK